MSVCGKQLEPIDSLPKGAEDEAPPQHVPEADKGKWYTPDEILKLDRVTESYLCTADENIYNIDFSRFKIRDMETDVVLFEIAKPPSEQLRGETAGDKLKKGTDSDGSNTAELDPNSGRYVRYQFTPQFLKLKTLGAT